MYKKTLLFCFLLITIPLIANHCLLWAGWQFEDDFSVADLTQNWVLSGTPNPVWVSSAFGRSGLFDNNGDSWYGSQAYSKSLIGSSGGYTIESEVYVAVTNLTGCWVMPSIGITRQVNPAPITTNDADIMSGIDYGISFEGDACWATPSEYRRHGWFWISIWAEDNTTNSPTPWSLNADGYLNSWHIMKITVQADRYVKFYCDGNLIWTSTKKLHPDLMTGRNILLGNRSSNSAGKAYHNWIRVSIGNNIISGNIKDKNGNNLVGIEVQARLNNQVVSVTHTDLNGNYTLNNLNNQNYEVRGIWEGTTLISSAWQTVPAGSTNVNFTLTCEASSISGQILGFKKSSVSNAGKYSALGISGSEVFIEVSHNNMVIAKVPVDGEGNYKIKGLLPGKFVLRGYNGYIYSEPKTITLSEGQNAVINFDFNFDHMPESETYTFPNPSKTGRLSFRFYCDYDNPEFEIKVYTTSGELFTVIKDDKIDKTKKPIYYYKDWECKTDSGDKCASGVYIYILKAKDRTTGGETKIIKKFAIVK